MSDHNLTNKLYLETAKIDWCELERYFAAGKAIYVAPSLDLIEVAKTLHADDTAQLQQWMNNQQVNPVSDQQALSFASENAQVWALVLAPWVLVQAVQQD